MMARFSYFRRTRQLYHSPAAKAMSRDLVGVRAAQTKGRVLGFSSCWPKSLGSPQIDHQRLPCSHGRRAEGFFYVGKDQYKQSDATAVLVFVIADDDQMVLYHSR